MARPKKIRKENQVLGFLSINEDLSNSRKFFAIKWQLVLNLVRAIVLSNKEKKKFF